jgi:hypothetical protein
MQEPQAAASSTTSASFASLLTALATPAQERIADWNDDDFKDDVTTISYEQALRTHARYQPADLDFGSTRHGSHICEPHSKGKKSPPSTKDRKAASITIRLSQAECAQVRLRASDAGLTMSAYLRSCVLEAEILRNQVKEALTQLRAASAIIPQAEDRKFPRTRSWRDRLFSRWSHASRAIDA